MEPTSKIEKCECGHNKVDHYDALGTGCIKTICGFPCRCEGFRLNKSDLILELGLRVGELYKRIEAIEALCKHGNNVSCQKILFIIHGYKEK